MPLCYGAPLPLFTPPHPCLQMGCAKGVAQSTSTGWGSTQKVCPLPLPLTPSPPHPPAVPSGNAGHDPRSTTPCPMNGGLPPPPSHAQQRSTQVRGTMHPLPSCTLGRQSRGSHAGCRGGSEAGSQVTRNPLLTPLCPLTHEWGQRMVPKWWHGPLMHKGCGSWQQRSAPSHGGRSSCTASSHVMWAPPLACKGHMQFPQWCSGAPCTWKGPQEQGALRGNGTQGRILGAASLPVCTREWGLGGNGAGMPLAPGLCMDGIRKPGCPGLCRRPHGNGEGHMNSVPTVLRQRTPGTSNPNPAKIRKYFLSLFPHFILIICTTK